MQEEKNQKFKVMAFQQAFLMEYLLKYVALIVLLHQVNIIQSLAMFTILIIINYLQVPQIVTVASNELLSQVNPSDLVPASVTGDNPTLAHFAADGLLSTSYASSAEDCNIILDFGESLQAHVH